MIVMAFMIEIDGVDPNQKAGMSATRENFNRRGRKELASKCMV
jgi:hypothetical protein